MFEPSNGKSSQTRLPREPSSEECQAYIDEDYDAITSIDQECGDSILPVFMDNIEDDDEIARRFCIPACQSWYDFQEACGFPGFQYQFLRYCGRNENGASCYETEERGEATQTALDAICTSCSQDCRSGLDEYLQYVGCCYNTSYTSSRFDVLLQTCGFTIPQPCTILFNSPASRNIVYFGILVIAACFAIVEIVF